MLFVVSSKYSQLNAQNMYILKNAIIIQRQGRKTICKEGLARRRAAIEEFQRLLRRKKTQLQVQQRLQAL